jgi:HAE1 family hydrophobic/amphiphilic exporter-1
VVASVLVSLFISFTLDPMLSAYWGDPPGEHLKPKTGISRLLGRFNDWFDHQADRYGLVIAWALAPPALDGHLCRAEPGGGAGAAGQVWRLQLSCRRRTRHVSIDVRTPSSSSLEYGKLKVEAAAALARTLPETKATNSLCQPGWRAGLRGRGQEHAAQAFVGGDCRRVAHAHGAPGRRRIRGASMT